MSTQQLERVAQWEQDKEDRCAQDFHQAQQYLQQQRQRLENLELYRREYLGNIQQQGQAGFGARSYTQYLTFVGQLDSACQQQNQVISQAILVAEQRKKAWLAQQRKRKAVEHLIQKKRTAALAKAERHEQALLDEFALQSFLRKRHAEQR
ncbi:flagellar export protein FliJ [Alteromonas oceanisediminis]|uniref:flagellar export protein FliJ n=1 Tax=Alteromonas oceanisediminis TaxID=2836180 RepID=UPI001BDAFA82|nr:flagellar export protein FliJ [Alteromonas oceanisediminis]MBT0584918.1 flagellar export protein FliJ [Alteromonas oceanisediminis]